MSRPKATVGPRALLPTLGLSQAEREAQALADCQAASRELDEAHARWVAKNRRKKPA